MLKAFGLTNIGCTRSNNEDLFVLAADEQLYVVADGMGGTQGGEAAAELAVDAVVSHVRQSDSRNAATLVAAFNAAHNRVAAESIEPDRKGMGCTLVAALIHRMMLFFANVGDSRGYVFAHGACQQVTADQTWINEVGRKLGIPDGDLKQHPYRHVLTVAVGVAEALRVNSYSLPIAKDMQVLLCTDGLHDVVSGEDIQRIMLSAQSAEGKCRSLLAAAIEAGAPDNVTCVVLDLAHYRNEMLALPRAIHDSSNPQ